MAVLLSYLHLVCITDFLTNGQTKKNPNNRYPRGNPLCNYRRGTNKRVSRKVCASRQPLARSGYSKHLRKPEKEIVTLSVSGLYVSYETTKYRSQKRDPSFSPMRTLRRKAENNTPRKKQ